MVNPLLFFDPSPLPFHRCLHLARQAAHENEVPVGAVITYHGNMIAESRNHMVHRHQATAHAEMLCLQAACDHLKTPFLYDCTLYVTLEPCPMCAAAIALCRVKQVYFGAFDPKGGGVCQGPRIFDHSLWKPLWNGGWHEHECAQLLQDFFKAKRFKP